MAKFTVTVPTSTSWTVTSCLAEAYLYTGDATKKTTQTAITQYVCTAIAQDLQTKVQHIRGKRQPAPAIKITPG